MVYRYRNDDWLNLVLSVIPAVFFRFLVLVVHVLYHVVHETREHEIFSTYSVAMAMAMAMTFLPMTTVMTVEETLDAPYDVRVLVMVMSSAFVMSTFVVATTSFVMTSPAVVMTSPPVVMTSSVMIVMTVMKKRCYVAEETVDSCRESMVVESMVMVSMVVVLMMAVVMVSQTVECLEVE